jgi:hypothetical protein
MNDDEQDENRDRRGIGFLGKLAVILGRLAVGLLLLIIVGFGLLVGICGTLGR